MAYRLGILISLLLIGIVLLYLRKKEGWEWDKLLLLFTVTVIVMALLIGIGIFIYINISDKPEIQTSFWHINLESSKPSIEFIKGPPQEATDDGYWIYSSRIKGDAEIYFIKFQENQLWVVGYLKGGSSGGPGIQGIKKGSRLDDIVKYFGEPSQVSDIEFNRSKLYLYQSYKIFFVIKEDKVSMYGAYNPKHGSFIIKETFQKYLSATGADFRPNDS